MHTSTSQMYVGKMGNILNWAEIDLADLARRGNLEPRNFKVPQTSLRKLKRRIVRGTWELGLLGLFCPAKEPYLRGSGGSVKSCQGCTYSNPFLVADAAHVFGFCHVASVPGTGMN